jgi:hypothetical protein
MTNRRRELSVFDSLLAPPRTTGFGFRIPIFPQTATRDPVLNATPAPGGLLPRDPRGSLLSPFNAERVVRTAAKLSPVDAHPAVLAASARQPDSTLPQGKSPRLPAVNVPGETQVAESLIENDNLEAQSEIDALKHAKGRKIEVRMEGSRIWAIKNNRPAVFKVSDSARASGTAPSRREHEIGVEAVRKHDKTITEEAARFGVDPNLVRAIMYIENADGHRFGLDRSAQDFGRASSLLPMNIKPKIWEGIGGVQREQFRDPKFNIRAGVALIKEIRDRIENPSPAKIGSVWQFTGRETVSDNGAKIEAAFRQKIWQR